jgi:hypothetical protein
MRGNKPRRPGGSGPEAIFAQSVWDMLWGGGLNFIDSPTVKFSRTTRGISAHGAQQTPPGASASPFKLFLVTVASADAAASVNVSEIRLTDDGLFEVISAFGTIAKPLHLRPESKPSAQHVVYPGYTLSAQSGQWISGVPRAWGLVVGFKPPFGTGIEDVEWMDTGMIARDWAIPEEVCTDGVPRRRYFRASASFV